MLPPLRRRRVVPLPDVRHILPNSARVRRGRVAGSGCISSEQLPAKACDLDVCQVLAQRVDRPDRGRDPTDQRELQGQADDAGDRSADREERQPGQHKGEEKSHEQRFWLKSMTNCSLRRIAWPARSRAVVHSFAFG